MSLLGLSADFRITLPTPGDSISCIGWCPSRDMLATGGWDGVVRVFELSLSPAGSVSASRMVAEQRFPEPVLDIQWGDPEPIIFVGCCDGKVYGWSLEGRSTAVLGEHANPVKALSWEPSLRLLVSGSWDKTVKFWDPRTPPTSAPPLPPLAAPERVYSISTVKSGMVVGCADRRISLVSIDPAARLCRSRDMVSPLKFQTRAVTMHPSQEWFAVAGVNGRIAMASTLPGREKDPQAFVLPGHRTTEAMASVNSVEFHPVVHHIMATAGGDGRFCLWDLAAHTLIHQSDPRDETLSCAKFNPRGDLYAYASAYEWTKGPTHTSRANEVLIHHTTAAGLAKRGVAFPKEK